MYCHYGQASYAVDLLNSDYVDNLNGLGKEGDVVYFRSSDKKKPKNERNHQSTGQCRRQNR